METSTHLLVKNSLILKNDKQQNIQFIFNILLNGFILFGAIYTYKRQGTYYLASQVLFTILYFRSFALFHDAAHNLIHRNNKINDTFGILYSLFCFLPYQPWKLIHLEHHKWTGHIEKDPVLLILREFPKFSVGKKNYFNFIWRLWIPMIAYQQHVVFWKMGHVYFKKAQGRKDKILCVLSYLCLFAFYSSVFMLAGAKNMALMLPSVILYLIVTELINVPHHLSLNTKSDTRPSTPSKQYEFCRSCHHSFFVSYFLLCNFNYHTEHHMYPYLPWYQLHKMKDSTEKTLANNYNKSSGLKWLRRNRKKNIEDVLYGHPIKQREDKAA